MSEISHVKVNHNHLSGQWHELHAQYSLFYRYNSLPLTHFNSSLQNSFLLTVCQNFPLWHQEVSQSLKCCCVHDGLWRIQICWFIWKKKVIETIRASWKPHNKIKMNLNIHISNINTSYLRTDFEILVFSAEVCWTSLCCYSDMRSFCFRLLWGTL